MGMPGFPGINGIHGLPGPSGPKGLAGLDGCNGTDVSCSLTSIHTTTKTLDERKQNIKMAIIIWRLNYFRGYPEDQVFQVILGLEDFRANQDQKV